MLKKYLFVLSILFASNLFADGFLEENSYLYGGISGGIAAQKVTDNYTQLRLTNPPTTYTSTGTHQQNNIIGQLFAGYGLIFCEQFYAGVEASVSYYSKAAIFYPLDPHFFQLGSAVRLTEDYGYQVAFQPGFFATPNTLIYGRVGYTNDRYKNTFATDIGVVSPKLFVAQQWVPNPVYGIGINQGITEHIGIRIDYNYKPYKIVNGERSSTFTGNPDTTPNVVATNTHQNNYTLNSQNILFGVFVVV